MKIEDVRTTGRFEKQYQKLPKIIKESAKEKESILRANPFDPRLDTHKLHGREKEIWAFSINRSYRIKFIFINNATVLFIEIGTHKIYK